MHWGIATSLLLLLAAAESPRRAVPEAATWGVILSAIALLASWRACRSMASAMECLGDRRARQGRRLLGAVSDVGPLLLAAACAWIWNWPGCIRFHYGLGDWFLVDDMLLAAPVLCVAAAVGWFSSAAEVQGGDAFGPVFRQRLSAMGRKARASVGVLGPVFLLLILSHDILELAAPQWAVGPRRGVLFVPLLALAAIGYPWLLRRLFPLLPMPETLQNRLAALASRAGVAPLRIALWNTDGAIANAMTAGLTRATGVVFLTDGLLNLLNEQELDAVFLHELAHLKRRHLVWRMLTLLIPLGACLAAAIACPEAVEHLQQFFRSLGVSPDVQKSLLLPGAVSIYGFVALGVVSRISEYDADAWACRLAPDRSVEMALRARVLARAIRKLCLYHGGNPRRDGWLHPSPLRRICRLRAQSARIQSARTQSVGERAKDDSPVALVVNSH